MNAKRKPRPIISVQSARCHATNIYHETTKKAFAEAERQSLAAMNVIVHDFIRARMTKGKKGPVKMTAEQLNGEVA